MSEHIDEEERSYVHGHRHGNISGRVVACPKCGRELLVDAAVYDRRFVADLGGRCLECVELDEGFRKQCPEIAAAIDRWKAEAPKPE